MALAEGQVQVRDLVMGPGTPYRIRDGFNPWTLSARIDSSSPRSGDHGSWSGAEWRDELVVPIPVLVQGETRDVSGWSAAHQALAAAFAPSHTDVELRWCLGGVEYVMFGRPRLVEPDPSLIGLGLAHTRCAFAALDPRIYSGTETVISTGLPSSSGGLTWPATATILNANPYLEVDASNWSGQGGTVARSTAQAHQGSASLLLTPDGVSSFAEARAENVPVTPGVQYTASAWVRCSVARNVGVGINWRDSGGGFLSTSSTSISVAANAWTQVTVTATAPAGAAQGQLTAGTMTGTPPASNTAYIDEATLTRLTGGLTWPVTWPAVVTSGVLQVHNAGRVASRPRFVIYGPVSGPKISLVGDGRTLAWDITLAAGQWLDVDTDRRTSLINGQVSRSGQMTSREWFELPPGQSEIAFNAQLFDADARLSVAYRSAW